MPDVLTGEGGRQDGTGAGRPQQRDEGWSQSFEIAAAAVSAAGPRAVRWPWEAPGPAAGEPPA